MSANRMTREKQGKGRRVGRMVAVAAGAVLGLGLLEAALTAFWPQENVYILQLRERVVSLKPNFQDTFSLTPFASLAQLHARFSSFFRSHSIGNDPSKVYERTNREGLIDPQEHEKERRDSRFRILQLGECVSLGWPGPVERSYLKRLETRLPLETINCSLFDTNLSELSRRYEKLCSDYSVDLVILQQNVGESLRHGLPSTGLYGPDHRLIKILSTWMGNQVMEHVRRDSEGVPLLDWDTLDPGTVRRLEQYFDPRLPLYGKSQVVRFIENRWFPKRQLLPVLPSIAEALLPGAQRLPIEQKAHLAAEANLRLIDRLAIQVGQRGGRLLVLWLPLANTVRRGKIARPDIKELKTELAKRKIDYLDISDFVPQLKNAEEYFEPSPSSFPNQRGQEWISGVLVQYIQEKYGVQHAAADQR